MARDTPGNRAKNEKTGGIAKGKTQKKNETSLVKKQKKRGISALKPTLNISAYSEGYEYVIDNHT